MMKNYHCLDFARHMLLDLERIEVLEDVEESSGRK